MPFRELIDRSDTIFGRAPDRDHLLQRSERPGITAVVARSQMGKSTLLMELARRLSYKPPDSLLGPQPRLIGFTESAGETSDIMLRGVIDLYTRWLSDSTYREQAKIVWNQQKKDGVSKTGKTVGTLFRTFSAATPLKDIGDLVQKSFDALATANDDLRRGGLQSPPRLQSEQANELLTIIHEITGHPIVLVFDQWEKSLNIQLESNVLDTFLRHISEWPPCHIFLGLRPDGEPLKAVQKFHRERPAAADIHYLKAMELEGQSRIDLLQYLRQNVPVTNDVSDDDLLDMIAGYPEVVNRWTTPVLLGPGASIDDLRRVADDAHMERYPELESLLFSLPANLRPVAMRLSILPATKDPERWRILKPLILADAKPEDDDLGDLGLLGVLEAVDPPSYGHIKRTEAALRWFKSKRPDPLSKTCEHLIIKLAARIRDVSPQSIPYSESLFTIAPLASDLELSRLSLALCQSARSLFGLPLTAPDVLPGSALDLRQVDQSPVPLLAMGLSNTLIDAEAEQNLDLRDALLNDLRTLAHDHPEDAVAREWFAKALFNTLNQAKEEQNLDRRDALLIDLRTLAHDHPEDAAVRENLACGISNTLNHAKEEQKLDRRDALLIDLRTLAHDHPEDATVREWLATGLFNTLNYVKEEEDLDRRDTLLIDLRTLVHDHPEDAAVREKLAMGLFNTLIYAKQEEKVERRDALLIDLRSLAHDHPEDAAVREQLAKGLFSTLNHAVEEGKLECRDALLIDLRNLARAHPEDAAVREQLILGVFNTLIDVKGEQNLDRRDALVSVLRTLSHDHPRDAVAREWLTKGLFRTIVDAKEEQNLELRDALLVDLRTIASDHPEDAVVREQLAKGLFSTLIDAREEQNFERRDTLLIDLRSLASDHPEDAAVRENLALGLSNTLFNAREEQNLDRRDALLIDLRSLSHDHPEDAGVREWLAKSLFKTLSDVQGEGDLKRHDDLLNELRTLIQNDPEDPISIEISALLDPW